MGYRTGNWRRWRFGNGQASIARIESVNSLFTLYSAADRTILDLLPILRPFFPPGKWAATRRAVFCGEVGLIPFVIHLYYSTSGYRKPIIAN